MGSNSNSNNKINILISASFSVTVLWFIENIHISSFFCCCCCCLFLGSDFAHLFFNIKTFISQCCFFGQISYLFLCNFCYVFVLFDCSWLLFFLLFFCCCFSSFFFFLSFFCHFFPCEKMACLSLCHISIICSVSKFLSHFCDLYQYKNIHIFVCYSEFEYSRFFCSDTFLSLIYV